MTIRAFLAFSLLAAPSWAQGALLEEDSARQALKRLQAEPLIVLYDSTAEDGVSVMQLFDVGLEQVDRSRFLVVAELAEIYSTSTFLQPGNVPDRIEIAFSDFDFRYEEELDLDRVYVALADEPGAFESLSRALGLPGEVLTAQLRLTPVPEAPARHTEEGISRELAGFLSMLEQSEDSVAAFVVSRRLAPAVYAELLERARTRQAFLHRLIEATGCLLDPAPELLPHLLATTELAGSSHNLLWSKVRESLVHAPAETHARLAELVPSLEGPKLELALDILDEFDSPEVTAAYRSLLTSADAPWRQRVAAAKALGASGWGDDRRAARATLEERLRAITGILQLEMTTRESRSLLYYVFEDLLLDEARRLDEVPPAEAAALDELGTVLLMLLENPELRVPAAICLAQVESDLAAPALDILVDHLDSEEPLTEWGYRATTEGEGCAWAIGSMGERAQSQQDLIWRRFQGQPETPWTQIVGQVGGDKNRERLIRLLSSRNVRLKREAMRALDHWDEMPPELEALYRQMLQFGSDDDRRTAVLALEGREATPELLTTLLRILEETSDSSLRADILECFGGWAPEWPQMLPHLVYSLQRDPDPWCRRRAAEEIGKLGESARVAAPALIGVAGRFAAEQYDVDFCDLTNTCIDALEAILAPAEFSKSMGSLLGARSAYARARAAAILAKEKALGQEIRTQLVEQLADESWYAAWHARRALASLGETVPEQGQSRLTLDRIMAELCRIAWVEPEEAGRASKLLFDELGEKPLHPTVAAYFERWIAPGGIEPAHIALQNSDEFLRTNLSPWAYPYYRLGWLCFVTDPGGNHWYVHRDTSRVVWYEGGDYPEPDETSDDIYENASERFETLEEMLSWFIDQNEDRIHGEHRSR